MRKALIVFTIIALTIPMFANGKDDTASASADSPITLTYFMQLHKDAAQIMSSYNESYPYQMREEMTGIHIDFIHPPAGQETEQFNLIIASGDLPDIMGMADKYKSGPDKAIEDEMYLRLNELIEEFAPNLAALRASNPKIALQTITDEGNIYSFNELQPIEEASWLGAYMRGDLLEEAGLDVPETVEEWDTALRAFKDMGIEVPFLYKFDWTADNAGVFSGAFNSHVDFMQENKEVKYGPIQPGFKDFLALLNGWYEEGLLDSEMTSRDGKSRNALITSGKMGAFIDAYGQVASYEPALAANGFPNATIVPVPYPGANGNKATYKQVNFYNKGGYTAITTACEYPERAVAWFDYGYSEEGYLLMNYGGKEGETYTITPGKHEVVKRGIPVLTDLVLNNPEMPYQFAKWHYKAHTGPFLRDFRAFPFTDIVVDSMDVWSSSSEGEAVLPKIVMNDQESRKYSTIMGDIKTYVEEMRLKFVLGLEPLDEFDAFVSQVESMGIDEAIALKQAALNRYYNR